MGTTADKLAKLAETKEAIRIAIESKGVEVSTSEPFSAYPAKINAIAGGGASFETIVITMTLDGAANGSTTSDKLYKAIIEITDANTGEVQAFEWMGVEIPANVTAGHTYTVKAQKIVGYAPPIMLTYTAVAGYQRRIALNHITPPTGVYILMDDESLVLPSKFDSANADKVVGIYVGTSYAPAGNTHSKVVLYPEIMSCKAIQINKDNYVDLSSGYYERNLEVLNSIEHKGLAITEYLYNNYTGSRYTSFAHRKAWKYAFKNGAQGWIPTYDDLLHFVIPNWEAIVFAYEAIGATVPDDISVYNGGAYNYIQNVWSSTATLEEVTSKLYLYGWRLGYDNEDGSDLMLNGSTTPHNLISFSIY